MAKKREIETDKYYIDRLLEVRRLCDDLESKLRQWDREIVKTRDTLKALREYEAKLNKEYNEGS